MRWLGERKTLAQIHTGLQQQEKGCEPKLQPQAQLSITRRAAHAFCQGSASSSNPGEGHRRAPGRSVPRTAANRPRPPTPRLRPGFPAGDARASLA